MATSAGRAEEGCVKIGIFSSLASGFLPELLRSFGRRFANIRVELVDGNPAEHVAAVRQLRLDVAFVTGMRDWPECETEYLWSEGVFVVLPEMHGLCAQENISWHELVHEAFIVSEAAPGQEIHDFLVQRLASLGHHPDIRRQEVGRDNLLPMVALGRGLTLTSEAMTAAHFPGITYRPVTGEVLPFVAVWSLRNGNPALRRLLNLAKTISGAMPRSS